MIHHATQIKKAMANMSDMLCLPEIYKSDLQMDYDYIDTCKGAKKLLWLLRGCGTVLVPVGVGVDPVHITHWLDGEHGQTVVPFVIDIETAKIERLSFDQARNIINRPPMTITPSMSSCFILQEIENILKKGHELRFWKSNIKTTFASWSEWKQYFNVRGNYLMSDLIDSAINQVINNKV